MPFLISSTWNQVHCSLFEKTHSEWTKNKIKPNFRIIQLINCSSYDVILEAPSNEHFRSAWCFSALKAHLWPKSQPTKEWTPKSKSKKQTS